MPFRPGKSDNDVESHELDFSFLSPKDICFQNGNVFFWFPQVEPENEWSELAPKIGLRKNR